MAHARNPVIPRLKYVQTFVDRHGHQRDYFRRAGSKTIRLPSRDDEATFLAAYAAALGASAPPSKQPRVPERSLEALTRSYLAGTAFANLGASTQAVYRRIIAELVRGHGHKHVATLDTIGVEVLMMEKASTPAAANHRLRTLRALMQHAIRLKWRTDDPTQGAKRLAERGEGAETWTEADIAAYEARWERGTVQRLALALLLYTGQRRSDVVRMGRQHVRSNKIEVRPVKTRRHHTRLILPIHPELADLIARETDRLTFLVTEAGRPFTPNGFYMRFKGWCRQAGLPDRSPHGLRKAAARRLAELGCSAHEIMAITGHMTLAEVERYTKAADQERLAEQAMARIHGPKT